MKANKKMVMGLSFCLGLVMFVTTAFADIASKTGYEQMKDSIKFTTENLSEKLQSFSSQATITLKDNDNLITSITTTGKYDNKIKASEEISSTEISNGEKRDHYSYRDKNGYISKNSFSDTYYVSEYQMQDDYRIFPNPFKEERFSDVEKIIDALVGNLKDYVMVNEKADGSKEFSGSLSEGQIPALVNAVSSFAFKQVAVTSRYGNTNEVTIPQITSDLFIKNVKGKLLVNKDGIIESLFASGILSGKDKKGVYHDISLEVVTKISDINSTTVSKPNLEGKKIEKQEGPKQFEDILVSSKLVGKYKNNIVIEKDGKYVKIGERIVQITNVNGKNIQGRYYEEYKNEYAEYSKDKLDFTFDAVANGFLNAEFDYTDPSGITEKGSISFEMNGGKFYFNIPYKYKQDNGLMYDPSFSMVFDE